MITVYVLHSMKDGATYVGMAINVVNRLKEHNSGKNRYTKGHIPWQIIYQEVLPDWAAARICEKYLKSTGGENWLRKKSGGNEGITGSLPA